MEHEDAPRQSDRIGWHDLPEWLRAQVATVLGAPVVGTGRRTGGFSPGAALRLDLADGRRAFVKAVGTEPQPMALDLYRAEIQVNGWLPPVGAPALLGSVDRDGWVALLFEYVDAPTAQVPWRDDQLDLVLRTVRAVHERLTPCPPQATTLATRYDADFRGWRTLAAQAPASLDGWSRRYADRLAEIERRWPAATEGDTLVHADLRHDNLLVDADRAWIVDWPWAARGAAWADVVMFAPAVASHGGPPAAEVMARWPDRVDRDRLAAMVAAVAGFFTERALQPPPPGLPYLRAHQASAGAAARRWLADLLALR